MDTKSWSENLKGRDHLGGKFINESCRNIGHGLDSSGSVAQDRFSCEQ
jgi:hypothetical protein